MAFKCKNVVPSQFFTRMISIEKRQKFEKYLATAFVRSNTFMRWCPKAGCDRVVKYHRKGMKSIVCECGHVFCFGCGLDCHDPSPCQSVVEWGKKKYQRQ